MTFATPADSWREVSLHELEHGLLYRITYGRLGVRDVFEGLYDSQSVVIDDHGPRRFFNFVLADRSFGEDCKRITIKADLMIGAEVLAQMVDLPS